MIFGKSGPASGVEWLVVCLGNIGAAYDGTRHNVGFQVGDEIAARKNIPVQRLKFRALTNICALGGAKVLLMKPTTFMNLSGESAREAAQFYKIPPQRVIVISDDVSLPVGKLRLRASGSAGGHNGLRSLIAQLGSDQFPRVRVGVGEKPHPDYDLADWVLGKFTGEDKKTVEAAVKRATDAVECIIREGMERAMNQFN